MNLNEEQKKAVIHHLGPCVVTAVPGSGKTSVLTARAVYLINKRGVDPRNILCATFTNKAADEMRERISKYTKDNTVFISTFHGLCLAILRKYGERIGLPKTFTIYSEKEQLQLIEKIARMQGYEINEPSIKCIAKALNNFREDIADDSFQHHVSDLNSMEIDIVQEYLTHIDELCAVDFSGMLYKCWILLKDQEIIKILSDRFKFIMIDESQDMNLIQYDICKRLGVHRNIFLVGDYCQSVFGWRSARPEILHQITKEFPDIVEITLPRNYRSTTQILTVAERLINHNTDTPPVKLISERGSGSDISIQSPPDADIEASNIADKIISLKRMKGYDWQDFAVLYRINSLSKTIEIAMRNAEIPYKIVGGFSFFDRKEIKGALAYFSLVANPFDTISFARAVSEPKRSIGAVAIGKIERYCHENKVSILDCRQHIQSMGLRKGVCDSLMSFLDIIGKYHEQQSSTDLGELACGLLKESGYIKHIEEVSKADESSVKRSDNVVELLKSIVDFGNKKKKSSLSDYLQNIQLLTSDSSDEKNVVSLLTMHSAKGLEFKTVFVIGCDKSVIPHPLALKEDRESEERRLLYVAITRAKDHLFISYPQRRQKFMANGRLAFIPCMPSNFLFELYPKLEV